eukprot:NODE_1068_length_1514_cov_0.063604.p2 type:complete len:113 gc:universal NODE_1068_length_1514_cov_0.063604:1244-906(-)
MISWLYVLVAAASADSRSLKFTNAAFRFKFMMTFLTLPCLLNISTKVLSLIPIGRFSSNNVAILLSSGNSRISASFILPNILAARGSSMPKYLFLYIRLPSVLSSNNTFSCK